MPQIRLGNTQPSNLKLGNSQVQKVYLGTTLVWTPGQEWLASGATLSHTARSSTWGPALVPAGRTVHWDASHEQSITYRPDTNYVVKWEDLSGNNWYLAEPVPGTYNQIPLRVIGYNGLPVLRFEADQWLVHWIDSGTPAQINLPQPFTIQVVAAAAPYTGYPTGLIGGQGGLAGFVQITALDDRRIMFAAPGPGVFYPYDTDQHIITAVFNGASSVQRIDGVQVGTGNVGTDMLVRLQIGITHQLMDVTACEWVYYDRVLTGTEIAYNENLLKAKWFKPPGVWTGSAATVTIQASARTWYAGTAPAFRPDIIETCFAWWDASDATTFTFRSGVQVQQWRDKTSAGHHLASVAAGAEPDRTGTINGLAVVDYDGTGWQLILPEPGVALQPQPTTIFVVATMQTYTDWTHLIAGSVGGLIARSPSSTQVTFSAGVNASYTVDTAPHLFGVVFDRGLSQQRIDGLQVGKTNTGPMNFGPLRVGTGSFSGHTLHGQIAEICLYERNLNSVEITEIEAYLTAKWFGPPLPQTWTGSILTAILVAASSGVWGTFSTPSAPSSVNGTAGDTQVMLTWAAPSSNGGTGITSYTMQYAVSPPGTSWSSGTVTGSTALAGTVTGLTNDQAYVFRVAATNAVGTGAFSSASSAVTPVAGASGLTVTKDFHGGSNFINTSNTTPLTLPSWSVTNGDLLIVALAACGADSAITSRWSLAGGGLTWTKIVEATQAANYAADVAFYRAIATSTTTITNLVATPLSCLSVCYAMYRAVGYHATTPIGATAAVGDNSTDGQKDITLSGTPSSTSIVLAGAFLNADDTATVKGVDHGASDGWTEDFDFGPSMSGSAKWGVWEGQRKTSPSLTRVRWDDIKPASFAGNTYTFAGAAIEVKSAGGGAPPTVPDAPTGVTGNSGDTTVSLLWTAPGSDGGAAITGYTVQNAVSPPGTAWSAGTATGSLTTSYTVTGLTNGTAYVFRVAATNSVGQGAYSTASSPVTPAVSTWDYDFTDDPNNSQPAGWTTTSGTEVGNAKVVSGIYRCPANYWYSVVREDAAKSTLHRKIKAEVVWLYDPGSFNHELWIMFRNSDMSVYRAAALLDDGSVGLRNPSGGTNIGTWTPPTSAGTPFTVEVEWNNGTLDVWVNGALVGHDTPGTTAGIVYGGMQMAGGVGTRKWEHKDV